MSKRPSRLGPFGPGVVIHYFDHALEIRLPERIVSLGVTRAQFEDQFRSPILKKVDELDPVDGRIRRWVRFQDKTGKQFTFRVVFYEDAPPSQTSPGVVTIVTIRPETKPI